MIYNKAVLLFFVLFQSLLNIEADDDVSCKSSPCIGVEVYYESLCGDSMRFINNQLTPSYSNLQDHLEITYIPYGKASHQRNETGQWSFTCQHGHAECQGNKAQACAIDAIEKFESAENYKSLTVKLVGCVMSKFNPATAVPECSQSVGLSEHTHMEINKCLNNTDGDELLAAHGEKTHNLDPILTFVPTIILDKQYSDENQNAALSNFKQLICGRLPSEVKPNSCAA